MAAVIFSMAVNVLMLTGPLYMLQVYDRVLASRSEATLVVLTGLVIALFLAMGVLDFARGWIMAIFGARFQDRMDSRVFACAMQNATNAPLDPIASGALRDLDAIRLFLASPALVALLDLPWTPIFVLIIFLFHPLMGWLAIAGGGALIGITLLNQRLSRQIQRDLGHAAGQADQMSDQMKGEAEVLRALGMSAASLARWQTARRQALKTSIRSASLSGAFGALIKTFRLFLQSAMLGLGAWLVLQDALTAGAMIVASTLLGRGLAPIESAVAHWSAVQRAQDGWQRLGLLLAKTPALSPRTSLPRPRALLEVDNLTVTRSRGSVAILRQLSFRLDPGQAIGVIGPSGAGKSSLARVLTGAWTPASGRIRLDGASLDQYDPDVLGRSMGYLPQRITLFDGTIAENIARLDRNPDGESIFAAARKADAHDMIVRLPEGYDTRVTPTGGHLSGGQIQRIGLARALYGSPVLLILDEPNANLDNDGSIALNKAIRALKAEGNSVLIMAHRPAAIQECDLLLVLEDGMRKGFGPRDQVLRDLVRNHTDLLRTESPGSLARSAT